MNIAILSISSLSLVCSAGSLYFMYKTHKSVTATAEKLSTDVEAVKAKVSHNAEVVKTAISSLEV